MADARPRLALIPGEPAGIGPELCVRLIQQEPATDLLALADPATLQAAAAALGLPLQILPPDRSARPGALPVLPITQAVPTRFGHADPRNAAAVMDALSEAARLCQQGTLHGMVTGPVHKANINAGGFAYTGTTELLAGMAGVDVVMMLATPALRVALVTTHLPLRDVPAAVTAPLVERCLRILHRALQQDFGIAQPRIDVLGLNPHAGEDGLLGREEIDVIIPVLQRLRAEGLALRGPLPADTAFLPQLRAGNDAVLAMYHDQGLPVLKASGFEQGINITLGLPYPRVAVDHGTALDLAGTGRADPASLIAAVRQCAALAQQRARR